MEILLRNWSFKWTISWSLYDDGIIRKLAAYIVLGINDEGKKHLKICGRQG